MAYLRKITIFSIFASTQRNKDKDDVLKPVEL